MANDRIRTSDGTPIGGWVLRDDPAVFDVGPMLEEFGQVFRYPLEPSDRVALLDAGQPCFLFRSDTSKVVGIWAIGEVVAPAFRAPVDPDDPGAGEQLFAEVELLPLAKPIAAAKLKDHKDLAGSELLAGPGQANPVVLRPAEVRAIEEFEFEIVEPTDEQLARLEEVLGDDGDDDGGLVFQLIGLEDSFGIRIDGDDDGLLSVFTINAEGAFELGRFEEFSDAMDLLALRSAELELAGPVAATDDGELPEGDPIALLDTEDGLLAIFRTGPDRFDLYDPEPGPDDDDGDPDAWSDEPGAPELLGTFESLADVLAALAEAVEEVPEE